MDAFLGISSNGTSSKRQKASKGIFKKIDFHGLIYSRNLIQQLPENLGVK